MFIEMEGVFLTLAPEVIFGSEKRGIADNDGINHIKAPIIKALDTTGAGDCFNGNLAACLSKGLNLKEAVKCAVFAGAWCAERLGVINGLPYEKELSDYIMNNK